MDKDGEPDVLTARYLEVVDQIGRALGYVPGWKTTAAKDYLQISPTQLSKLLSGERHVTDQVAMRAALRMGFPYNLLRGDDPMPDVVSGANPDFQMATAEAAARAYSAGEIRPGAPSTRRRYEGPLMTRAELIAAFEEVLDLARRGRAVPASRAADLFRAWVSLDATERALAGLEAHPARQQRDVVAFAAAGLATLRGENGHGSSDPA